MDEVGGFLGGGLIVKVGSSRFVCLGIFGGVVGGIVLLVRCIRCTSICKRC